MNQWRKPNHIPKLINYQSITEKTYVCNEAPEYNHKTERNISLWVVEQPALDC